MPRLQVHQTVHQTRLRKCQPFAAGFRMTLLVNPVVLRGFSVRRVFHASSNKPWFRAQTGWWMVKLGGKQQKLVHGKKNKKAALTKFHELMAAHAELPESPDARVADICEAFLDFSSKNHAPDTYRNHRFYLQEFAEAAGQVLVTELRPYHVTRWIDGKPAWKETTRFNAKRYAFRAMNWAVGEGG